MTHAALDPLRFAVGTLTAIPVRPPASFERRVTVPGMLLAPVAVLPLGLLVAGVLWGGRELGLAPLAVAAAAIAALALGSRGFHLDGLADTTDALASSYDAERSLAVMKRGDTGPAGAAAIALVLAVQVGAAAALLAPAWGPVLAGALVCASRGVAVVLCVRGLPPARKTGLAASYVSSVPPAAIVGLWLVLAAALCAVAALADLPWWRGLLCAAVALAAVAWLARRAVRRFGGVAGDVMGAAIEVALALMLLAAT
ncbi:adenosylcobinamide-GDP ribazoletransferase [Nocardioides pantholopis]|uniref:adenosylcobinamide-GDP ribazoletransferase n=1 Tax=Nocardioides pantholopis TaxID=2483798 RepID=UPI001F155BCE|nr:adenosylcobinamide-GDP ribazoletransferase [Nocardioides pantholopis]